MGALRVATPTLLRTVGIVVVAVLVLGACSPGTPSNAPSATVAGAAPSPTPSSTISASEPSPVSAIQIGSLKGTIVFTRAGGQYGDDTLFSVHANGEGEQRILDFNQSCCPRFSPNGAQILVPWGDSDGKRLTSAILRPDGTLVRRLPLPKGPLGFVGEAWSPDGAQLALMGEDDADPSAGGIYVARASDGGSLRLVLAEHGQIVDFSADAKTIFYLKQVPDFPSIGDQRDGSLWAVNIDGTGRRRLTPQDMPVENINMAGRASPDGQWIAFTSAGVIWRIHPNGSGLTKVFQDAGRRIAVNPTWSPDGAFLLFGLDPAGSLATAETPPENALYVIRSDGSDLTPVLISPDWKREPEWRLSP